MKAHEDDQERTFAALPPAHGKSFAGSWWGRAWLAALEDGALDSKEVRTGRRLARAGAVGAVSVRPGRITAVVQDRGRTAHRADVLLDELSDTEWDRFLDLAAERSGHVAALLDREMPPHLVEDAETAGVALLPGLGELEARCDCGAWDHCGHTAALCYQVARLLDQDPFVLLLIRGRAEQTVLDDLQARGAAAPPVPEPARPEGVDAADAFAAGDVLPSLPALPEAPSEPGVPPSLDTDVPSPPGVDPAALRILAARTAADARLRLVEALREGAGSPASAEPLTVAQDAVRLAAGEADEAGSEAVAERLGAGSGRGREQLAVAQDAVRLAAGEADEAGSEAVAERLGAGSGRGREQLARAVRAWGYGGAAALSVLEEEWAVEGEALARARAALESAWEEDERPVLRARGNRWTAAGESGQLRLGRDGRWWPYRKEGGRWTPAGIAARDPATALAATRSAADGGEGGEDTEGGEGGEALSRARRG
ncbi:SWF or SNF family helicase [Streptomyces sp. NPDC005820]|uniref:SWF or SNF family helicase n=1 Tax=Streptomyces sp. NPDC005820 TaxID=3157069 RepID=UPI0033CE258B